MTHLRDEDIKEVLEEVVRDFLIPKFYALGMNASGNWVNSLAVEVVDGNGYIKGTDYTYYLVNGRAQGTPPPIQPLINWVANKMGITGKEGVNIAYAVKNKIAKEGTDYYKNNTDLLEVLTSQEVTQFIYTRLGVIAGRSIRLEIVRRIRERLLTNN